MCGHVDGISLVVVDHGHSWDEIVVPIRELHGEAGAAEAVDAGGAGQRELDFLHHVEDEFAAEEVGSELCVGWTVRGRDWHVGEGYGVFRLEMTAAGEVDIEFPCAFGEEEWIEEDFELVVGPGPRARRATVIAAGVGE